MYGIVEMGGVGVVDMPDTEGWPEKSVEEMSVDAIALIPS